jgi:HK97 family phage major capsid protein
MDLAQMAEAIKTKAAAATALLGSPSPSAEETTRATALLDEADALKAQYDLAERAAKTAEWARVPQAAPPAAATAPTPPADGARPDGFKGVKVPNRGRSMRADMFVSDDRGDAHQKAHALGMWALASLFKDDNARALVESWGIPVRYDAKAMSEGVGSQGGYIVPDEFTPEIIRIVEQYGVARRVAHVYPMKSDTKLIPRRTGGVTAYPIGEGTAPTQSNPAFDMVELVARKWGTLTYFSTELQEDEAVGLGNLLAKEVGSAFAYAEDNCLINGDGTLGTYNGVVGMVQKLKDAVTGAGGTWTTDAHKLYSPAINAASGSTWAGLALVDFEAAVGCVISTANDPSCCWVCSLPFYWTVMRRLALAAGATQPGDIATGAGNPLRFLGYPVVISQRMPVATAIDTVSALFGNFDMAVAMGDRRSMALAQSSDFAFSTDQVVLRGTERFDINVHDIGTASATAASRVAGPIAAIVTNHS